MWRHFVTLFLLPMVTGHGRLLDPPSRSTMWRYGFNNPPNYDDNQMYCGGVQVQYERNGGKCGVCGDPWHESRLHEPPGMYANGIIVRKYSPGEVIKVVIELTASHKGWMEFKICPNDDPKKTVTQDCLDKHVLQIADTRNSKHHITSENSYQKIKLNLQLPPAVKCKACVFQWKYNAGNSWGTDLATGRGCVGCGNQEQFYGCADIAIGYDDVFISSHRTPLPADVEKDDISDDRKHTHLTKDLWTTKPSLMPTIESNPEPANTDENQQLQQMFKSLNYVPLINANGMNLCMCMCKKTASKLQGWEKDSKAVKYLEEILNMDTQMCMCMCQNSAAKRSTTSGVVLVLCVSFIAQLINLIYT